MRKWEHLISNEYLARLEEEFNSHPSAITATKLLVAYRKTGKLNEADTSLRALERIYTATGSFEALEAWLRAARRVRAPELRHLELVKELWGKISDKEITQMEASLIPNRVNIASMKYGTHGTILYHRTAINADGSPARWRINGKVQFWKTRPTHFKVPVKRGMREYGYMTQDNAEEFSLDEKDASKGRQNF